MKNKKVNLNDICFFQEGPGVRKHQYCTKGVKLINVSNLVNGEVDLSNSNRYISQEEAYGRYKHFLIDEGDLIIASSGIKVEYLDKKVAFIKKENLPLCMNTSTIRFKVKNKNELDILYLSYFLKSKNFKNQISKLITGSAQLNFGGSHLKKINLFLPELNVQKKVSTLLLLIDNTIKNMQRKISILEQLTKSLFTRMFGDIKTNSKNWEVKKIEDCILNNVKNINLKEKGEIAYIDISSINNKENKILSYKKYNSISEAPSRAKKILNENDILISTVRPALKNIAIFSEKVLELTIASTGFCILRAKDTINNKYIFEIIKSDNFTETLIKKQIGANYPAISDRDIKSIKIPVPPIELQNKFAERTEKIEKLKFTIWKIILKVYKILKKKGVENN